MSSPIRSGRSSLERRESEIRYTVFSAVKEALGGDLVALGGAHDRGGAVGGEQDLRGAFDRTARLAGELGEREVRVIGVLRVCALVLCCGFDR